VQGVIAGKVSKSNTVGYIASFPIPEVVRGINAFLLGAHSVNPDIKLKVVWVYTWFDPPKEADAAKVLMDQGADIITQHTDSTAALQAAAERGVHAFGQASDMIHFAPKTQLTANVNNWGPYYVARAKAVLDGTWSSSDTWDGMAEGMVVMAPFTNMTADVAELAAKTAESIRTGALHPFAGPISNQAGEVVVPAGAVADDGMLAGMKFYVEGVDDKLPQ
jgi:simple sugar transport system substrate-binding protein